MLVQPETEHVCFGACLVQVCSFLNFLGTLVLQLGIEQVPKAPCLPHSAFASLVVLQPSTEHNGRLGRLARLGSSWIGSIPFHHESLESSLTSPNGSVEALVCGVSSGFCRGISPPASRGIGEKSFHHESDARGASPLAFPDSLKSPLNSGMWGTRVRCRQREWGRRDIRYFYGGKKLVFFFWTTKQCGSLPTNCHAQASVTPNG